MRRSHALILFGMVLLGSCATLPPAAMAATPSPPAGNGDTSLNFAATDIHTVIGDILGDILHVSYTVDPAVTGTVTYSTTATLPRAGLIPLLQTFLAGNNAVLVQTNGLYRVMPAGQTAAPAMATGAIGGTMVLTLRYADAAPLAAALQPYISAGGAIVAVPGVNALIIQGDPATRSALAALARAFDVDELAGQSYKLFPVTDGNARDFATAFSAALTRQRGTQGPVRVVPLERIGAVLVIARAPDAIGDATRIYEVLAQMQRETVRSWHVLELRNSRASDAAYVLQQAFTPDDVTAQPAPAGGQAASSGATGAANGTPAAPSVPASGGIEIVPDVQNNAVLVYATAQEDEQVEAVLAKVDIMPVEVRIDATIAEVQLTGALQYGTQFFFKSGGMNAVLSTSTSDALATNFPGFVLSGHGSDAAPVAISALQSLTAVQVLASPELTVLDGQAAKLSVGNLVPYLTQTSQETSVAGAPAVNSVSYRDTGVILHVTPHVGDGGLVTLDIAEEMSGVASTITTTGLNSPTFTDRAVSSRIVIADGQTLGLAGLVSDNDSHGNQGVPFLKNLPLLGNLFGSQNNTRTREEILVLITPHVIRWQQQALDLTADLQEHFAPPVLVQAGQ